jgi:uncharacterized protein with PQ loop repeat
MTTFQFLYIIFFNVLISTSHIEWRLGLKLEYNTECKPVVEVGLPILLCHIIYLILNYLLLLEGIHKFMKGNVNANTLHFVSSMV